MVITHLIGGLGNQMFQYAAGRRLAHIHKTELKLDIQEFEKYTLRKYALGVFNIKENFATVEEIVRLKVRKKISLPRRIISKIFKTWYSPRLTYAKENYFHFEPIILKAPDNVYLKGYWQSEKYFKDIEEIIRKEFTIKIPQAGRNRELSDIINSCESVSVHIRRGDYVSNPSVNKKHGACKLDYYQCCLQIISQKVNNPRFFLFSDDPKWVKDNFKMNYPLTIVDHNSADNVHEDLRLMAQCKHNIIANSTLSWWGAWLNPNPNKIVFTPKKWFENNELSIIDLIPRNWLKI